MVWRSNGCLAIDFACFRDLALIEMKHVEKDQADRVDGTYRKGGSRDRTSLCQRSPQNGNICVYGQRLSGISASTSADQESRDLNDWAKCPGYPGPIPFHFGARAARRNAWLATQCRSHPSPGEIPANREFFREFSSFRPKALLPCLKTTASQRDLAQFPTGINREGIPRSREFSRRNTEV